METIIAKLLAGIIIFSSVATATPETGEEWANDRIWLSMTDEQRYEASTELKARAVGLTEEEFIFFSSVVEAESDRSSDLEGKILIAEVIFNRRNSEAWPDTIMGVCCQSGQFAVVSGGTVCANRTLSSDWAIIEAHREIFEGTAPAVMYFNCIGYGAGTAYGYVGGNYFSC